MALHPLHAHPAEAPYRVVADQEEAAGLDIVSDGEPAKASSAIHTEDRDTSGRGDGKRNAPAGVKKFSGFLTRPAGLGGTLQYTRPSCLSDVKLKGKGAPENSIANVKTATRAPSGMMSVQGSLPPALKPLTAADANPLCIAAPAIRRQLHGAML